jgi:hypothetical protein
MAILQDPVMQSILQQAKGDPAALQEHMKNPKIRLVSCDFLESFVYPADSSRRAFKNWPVQASYVSDDDVDI